MGKCETPGWTRSATVAPHWLPGCYTVPGTAAVALHSIGVDSHTALRACLALILTSCSSWASCTKVAFLEISSTSTCFYNAML